MTDHYVVEPSAPKWLSTMLITIGSALIAALLMWIASSQLDINTKQAVILHKLESQEKLYTVDREDTRSQLALLLDNQNRIWPRLRAHGENIQILKRKFEEVCNCTIELKEPERF